MKMRWSLDALYTSFEAEEFKKDMEKTNESIESLKHWVRNNLTSKENAKTKLEEYISIQKAFIKLFTRLNSYAELNLSVEAKNETALLTVEKLEDKLTELTEPSVKFRKWLGSIENLNDIIFSSKLLVEHRFHLMEIVNKNKYLLSEEEEIVIAKMKNTGSNAWSKLQELLTATLLVDIKINGEEKQLPLPIIRNMAYDADKNLRKTAYDAELKSYKKIEESSSASLNGIKGEVLTISKMRGYKSPLERTLIDARMDSEVLEAMLSAMRESLPAFHKFYSQKAELLGYENGLPFYELFAPVGQVEMKYTYDEARDIIVDNFRTFSDKMADYAKNAFEERWIDAEPREGKRGGAFCANLHSIKESRILSNYTGSFSDVTTLAHELGHGYHGSCLIEESNLNSSYPMPLAETASIFCETIIKNAAIQKANKDEAFSILENDISDSGQVIVDIYSRYLFETEVFNQRDNGSLSVNKLKELMLSAQKEAYGDGLDHDYLHPYMWVNKPHYYFSNHNFYNFPYAFGLLFAKGLYAEYLNRGDSFVEEYDKLLSVTGKMNVADVANMMGIDIRSKEFWRNSLKLVESDIETFVNMK